MVIHIHAIYNFGGEYFGEVMQFCQITNFALLANLAAWWFVYTTNGAMQIMTSKGQMV